MQVPFSVKQLVSALTMSEEVHGETFDVEAKSTLDRIVNNKAIGNFD